MKYFIVFLLVLTAASSQAQIKLEHTYIFDESHYALNLIQVDSALWKYIFYNYRDSITLYNIDHSFDKLIILPANELPIIAGNTSYVYHNFSRRLFDVDDSYEFIVRPSYPPSTTIKVFKENGSILFRCDSCFAENPISTPNGVKMMVDFNNKTSVYSLLGNLPGSTAKSGVNSPSIITGNSIPTSAYPNPSNGQVRIEYKLPDGVPMGEIVISDIEGKEIKKYQVGNIFNDILIDKSDLPSGSYFYKLVTEKGESEAKKIIVLK